MNLSFEIEATLPSDNSLLNNYFFIILCLSLLSGQAKQYYGILSFGPIYNYLILITFSRSLWTVAKTNRLGK